MKFIVKLFPEITIKSKPVRRRFIKRLQSNLKVLLQRLDPAIKVSGQWDKLEVRLPSSGELLASQELSASKELSASEELTEAVIRVLGRTPGIHSFLQVEEFPLSSFADIFEHTRLLLGERLQGKTFAVRVKRAGQHDFTSSDLERYLGGGLKQHTQAAGVNLQNPEVTVRLEVREQRVFVVDRQFPGQGGFPVGSLEPVLSLISGGFDSTVSSYQAMKRGCKTHFCFFNLGGSAHEAGVKQVSQYLWQEFGASHRVNFVTLPFDEVVAAIASRVHHSQRGVILKRMMMRAADRLAEQLRLGALVTGESVAQVSSQTLPNLGLIDAVVNRLVLRPLVLTDKQEIIDTARAIGTFEFAESMPEYCGLISDRPTTQAREGRLREEEQKLAPALLDRVLESARVERIDRLSVGSSLAGDDLEVHASPGDAVIIDIRHPEEEEIDPLLLPRQSLRRIPFYQLESRFAELDTGCHYLLYCPRGLMSRLHALHLREQGYRNVDVYQPNASTGPALGPQVRPEKGATPGKACQKPASTSRWA